MKDVQELHAFYSRQLKEHILPFWLQNSIDEEYGGFYTCFGNSTGRLLGTDKYIWSQGRMIWVMSKMSTMELFGVEERERFLSLSSRGAQFLMRHALCGEGSCTFLVDREGKPKPAGADGVLSSSIYADCFVVLGLSRYAWVAMDFAALDFALDLYRSICARLKSGSYKTLPYPEISGWRTHGITMILNDVSRELSHALGLFGHGEARTVFSRAMWCAEDSLQIFAAGGALMREMVPAGGGTNDTSLPGRYINPGHSLEDVWFVIHAALRSDNRAMARRAVDIARNTFDTGWDEAYGGLFTFCDMAGGRPSGDTAGCENEPMVLKVQNDWSNKLWWPHSEGLYTLLLCHALTGDEAFLLRYRRLHKYAFSTFPNPDERVGEWIQIRDRCGRPQDKVVALPVKDPYHIVRNMALILDLLECGTDGVV